SVSGSLIPLRAGGRLLGSENIHKAARKIIELVTVLDVPMQRHAVELRKHIDRAQPGVQTIADRNIDNAIFATVEHSRFSAIFGERKQACARRAAHDDGKRPLDGARRQRSRKSFWTFLK